MVETGGRALDESSEIANAVSNIFESMNVDTDAGEEQRFSPSDFNKYMNSVCTYIVVLV